MREQNVPSLVSASGDVCYFTDNMREDTYGGRYAMVEEILITECIKGDILACNVCNKNGVPLVVKDSVINEYIKGRLIDLGIESVTICNSSENLKISRVTQSEFNRSYRGTVLQTREMLHELAAGKPPSYHKIFCISNRIQQNINNNAHIIRCLAEVRNADQYTYSHCVNVAFYAMLIAKWLKLSDSKIQKAIQSGLLHDIGKAKVPNKILCKCGILTKDEFDVMKMHTIFGYEMVKDIADINLDIKNAILLHHERIDGSGYPFQMNLDTINLYSRIIAVADVFDAMTSERVYKKRSTPFEVFEMFSTIGTSMFDPNVLQTFMNNLSAYLIGSNVLLNNGEIGEIAYIPLQNPAFPVIKVSSGYLDLSQEKNMRIVSMIKG